MLEENEKQDIPVSNGKKPVNFLEKEKLQKSTTAPKNHKGIFIITTIVLIIAGVFLIRAVSKPIAPDNPYDYDQITLEPKKPENILKRITNLVFKRQPDLKGQNSDRINILLLGMGGPGHNGPFLTDTMIISSIKPSTQQIAMISIPRDLGVDIPEYGIQKINSANAYGEARQVDSGALSATKVVEDTFNIDIPYFVRIDFDAFIEIIDAVGGIKIDVERTFTDSEFPAPNDKYKSLTFTKGIQTMDGSRALQYARSRHGNNNEGSDFARAKRQQKVILAIKEKVLSFQTLANPIRISKIIKSLGTHITTNIDFSDTISLLKIGRSMDITDIITLVLDIEKTGYLESSYTKEGAYILSPTSGDFKEMANAIKNIFELSGEKDSTPSQDTPAPTSVNIIVDNKKDEASEPDTVEIQNGTWNAGLAARIKEVLKKENINVSEIGNTQTRPIEKSGLYVISNVADPKIIELIQSSLNIPLQTPIPDGELSASSTDILIILGDDFVE